MLRVSLKETQTLFWPIRYRQLQLRDGIRPFLFGSVLALLDNAKTRGYFQPLEDRLIENSSGRQLCWSTTQVVQNSIKFTTQLINNLLTIQLSDIKTYRQFNWWSTQLVPQLNWKTSNLKPTWSKTHMIYSTDQKYTWWTTQLIHNS